MKTKERKKFNTASLHLSKVFPISYITDKTHPKDNFVLALKVCLCVSTMTCWCSHEESKREGAWLCDLV